MAVNDWLVEYSLKMGYTSVIKALEPLYPSDVDVETDGELIDPLTVHWLIAAIRTAVAERRFDKFDTVADSVRLLCRSVCSDDNNEQRFLLQKQQAFVLDFLLRLMHILSTVGKETSEIVVGLLKSAFGEATEATSNDTEDDAASSSLESSLTDAMYSAVRQYTLRLLLRQRRAEHFAAAKFPVAYDALLAHIDAAVRRLCAAVYRLLPETHLELISGGMKLKDVCERRTQQGVPDIDGHEYNDASVLLYLEMFPPGNIPSETELHSFASLLTDSQLSVAPPEFPLVNDLLVPNRQLSNNELLQSPSSQGASTNHRKDCVTALSRCVRKRNGARSISQPSVFTRQRYAVYKCLSPSAQHCSVKIRRLENTEFSRYM